MQGATCSIVTALLVVLLAMGNLQPLFGVKFNVPIFIEFNNYRVSQTNITLICVNEITGGQTLESTVLPFNKLTMTVTPDPKFNVYAELACYFYNNPNDAAYLVAIDPYAGLGPNIDPVVLQYEWNIGDACFDLVRHYVNGTKLIPCLYFWPQ